MLSLNYGKIAKDVVLKIGGPALQKKMAVGALKLRKASPTIMMVGGVIGIVGSGVLACRATLKIEPIIDDAGKSLDEVSWAEEHYEEKVYSEHDAKRDKTLIYGRMAIDIVRLYGPSLVMGAASIGLILTSHHIMNQRNLALMSAYETIKTGFDEYRKRVREELGEEEERKFRYGLKTEELVREEEGVPGQRGRKKKIKEDIETFDPNAISIYARFFDEASTEWEPNPEYNLMKVKQVQAWANDYLHANGYLFLNDVYDELGIPRTTEGQLVGWLDGMGDNYVDFGIYTNAFKNDPDGEVKRDFVNGRENCILLDFNVDGPIFRYI